jgi:hypothetical protein
MFLRRFSFIIIIIIIRYTANPPNNGPGYNEFRV